MSAASDIGHLIWGGYFQGGAAGGLVLNIFLFAVALLAGCVLGIPLGVVRSTTSIWVYAPLAVLLAIIRSVPLLLVVLWLFIFLQGVCGLRLDPIWIGCLALSLYATTHVSDIVRAGTLAISPNHLRAARAMGLGWYSINLHVVGPLALRTATPALATFAATLLKDSSVCYVIGVIELTQLVVFASTQHPDSLLSYQLAGALLFFAVSVASMRISYWFERRHRIAGTLS
ncbi:ABC transporter permease subunit [Bradyrhizobium diazoefficiens]|nr:ABC transporter permease subunit [Bradyrhizobium diazoefficiens]MBR0965671.1 ABC transporter permease subunit [Bradyrhizobium diazoefficiens]MBR0979363.1 ABC transporter permease subunit [Bradyrhizobium diazoefficiens]MBR1008555.1 ABC transporter permease subunit [Bradyrhizobium diazoefficiens]MBR1014696.1 ABC transporter permease subunit [Bradyrhizobium diazoefficiens]MBR1052516.1 ABC transporter permease subunit [Bradyrhizobium diazoefficiens]